MGLALKKPDTALRLATREDAEALTALRQAYYASQREAGLLDLPLDPTQMVAQTTPRLLDNPRMVVQLAEDETGAIIGYAYGQIRIVPGQIKPNVGSIEEFYVSPDARGGGQAEKLFDAVRAELDRRGAQRLQLRVLANNDTARRFWSRIGFRENVTIFEFEPGAGQATFEMPMQREAETDDAL
ncbi:N-acetyltransferase family protein [Paracoccaceae bacterium GXU_MW_L88]